MGRGKFQSKAKPVPALTLLLLVHFNMWKLYLLGIPGQLAIWLWFRMFSVAKKEESHGQEGAA